MLLDLGYKGRFWKFEKKVTGGTYTRCRLDRALVNTDWMAKFPLASVTHEIAATSDHSALFLDFGRRKEDHKKRDFKYEVMWESHEGLHDMLVDGWEAGSPCATVEEMRQKLTNLASGLMRWSNDTFGTVRKEIKILKRKLEELRGDPLRTGPSHAELKINEQLIEMYHREEIMWRQ